MADLLLYQVCTNASCNESVKGTRFLPNTDVCPEPSCSCDLEDRDDRSLKQKVGAAFKNAFGGGSSTAAVSGASTPAMAVAPASVAVTVYTPPNDNDVLRLTLEVVGIVPAAFPDQAQRFSASFVFDGDGDARPEDISNPVSGAVVDGEVVVGALQMPTSKPRPSLDLACLMAFSPMRNDDGTRALIPGSPVMGIFYMENDQLTIRAPKASNRPRPLSAHFEVGRSMPAGDTASVSDQQVFVFGIIMVQVTIEDL